MLKLLIPLGIGFYALTKNKPVDNSKAIARAQALKDAMNAAKRKAGI